MVKLLSLAALGFAALAAAQNSTSGEDNTNINYPYVVTNPGAYDITTRNDWCTSQKASCLAICGNRAFPNNCDPDTLDWQCTCSTFNTPNITQYSQTLPYFECQAYQAVCINSTNVASEQQACMAIPCGSKSPQSALAAYSSSIIAAMSTSMMSSSATMTTTSTSGAASAAATSQGAASANFADPAAMLAGALAVFGFAL